MKALASDYDGTLFFHDLKEGFKPENTKKIKEFQNQGNLFGICTGRPLGGVINAVKGHVDLDFYILATGSVILDKQLNPIYEKPMPRDLAREIFDQCAENEKPAIQVGYDLYSYKQKSPYPIEQIIYQDFDDLPDKDIYQFSLNGGTSEKASQLCLEINQKYRNQLIAYQNVDGIDVVSAGCSKGEGLKILKDKLNIELMCGIGDSYNDISMLVNADRSFTFTYSPKDVQLEATDIVGSIADAIELISR